jgi:dipeptidyl aminopeptidase/acylaminoacyl peptidase
MNFMKNYRGLFLGILSLALQLHALESLGQFSGLKLEEIMRGESFVGYSPYNARWNSLGNRLYFQRNDSLGRAQWSCWRAGEKFFESVDQAAVNREIFEEEGDWNAMGTKQVVSKGGMLKLLDVEEAKVRLLWAGERPRSQPYFVLGDSALVYRSGNNLYLQSILQGEIRQLTHIQSGARPKDLKNSDYLSRQSMELFEFVRREAQVDSLQKAEREGSYLDSLPSFYLEGNTLRSIRTSPDLHSLVMIVSQESKGKNTEMPSYVNASGYTEMRITRPKVGEAPIQDKIYISRGKGNFEALSFDSLPGIWDTPLYRQDYPNFNPRLDEPKHCRIQGPIFHPKENIFLLVLRSEDNKDRWIVCVDGQTLDWHLVDHQRDEAWIGGPGIGSWNGSLGTVGWLPEGLELYYQSEVSGYSHLYTYEVLSRKKRQVTQGKWEVLDLKYDRFKNNYFVFANKENPYEQYWYALDWQNGLGNRLGNQEGKSEWIFHSSQIYGVELASSANRPPELYIYDAQGDLLIQTHSTRKEFETYPWRIPEIIQFKASDGVEVPARLYKPAQSLGGPGVIFVHGAGYLQNVHRWWSSYYREYFFHNLLADLGFTVLDIDYRGSAGYGRDWRTAIYRHMGGRDLQDQVDGAAFMTKELGVDPQRIGIYGGSYGGFITLMALFQHPEIFKAGAALRSVTDWAHYNHPYTANILNTPETDSLAYRRSSPIYYAEQLESPLLMLHGMEDDNVHFQDIVRLTQILVEKEKENWELAVYPIESHGFKVASSWLDEYKRILRLFLQHLQP